MSSLLARLTSMPGRSLQVAAAGLGLCGLALLYSGTTRDVVLVVDGQPHALRTHARTVGAALHDAGWNPGPRDRVAPAPSDGLPAGSTIRLDRASLVAVQIRGAGRWVETPDRIPSDILAAAGWRMLPGDRVWADGLEVLDPTQPLPSIPARLRLEPAIDVALGVDGTSRILRSAAVTLGEALTRAGIALRQSDQLDPVPDTPLSAAREVRLNTSRPVTIAVDGGQIETRLAGPTVGEALAQAGIGLVGLDYTQPALDQPLPGDGRIRVVRVLEQVLVELKPIPFKTISQPEPSLELDTQKTIDPGAYGMQASRVRVRREDGREVARVVEGEWVAVEARARVVAFGTRATVKTAITPDGPIQYYRAVTVYATSYSPCGSAAGRCLYYTSSRKPVQKGVIAVSYAWYKLLGFGVPVYVSGYGFATIEDVGGGIPGRRWIDLGYSDSDYVQWGDNVTLYFLAPAPPDAPWILP